MRTAVCSIISPNYRHFARVLMASLRAHHLEWDRYILVVGGDAGIGEAEPFDVVSVDALHIPNFVELSFRYTMLELDTAVKPRMIEHLFRRGYDRVIYFDPDVFVYSKLEELASSDASFITLTPHLTRPVDDSDHDRERSILLAGAWNLGFIAITRDPQLDAFLDWWKSRLDAACVVEPEHGLFVDQKWIDLVPGLFDRVVSLRHEGYNVAYWNLQQRRITRDDDGAYRVNGAPLRFFHFSGFDPSFPRLVSRHDVQRVADAGGAARLFDDYTVLLQAAGSESFRHASYAYEHFIDGSRIADAARVAYRHSPQLQAMASGDPFARPELFRAFTDRKPSFVARAKYHTYHFLSRARPLVRLIPKPLRGAMREGLLGAGAPAPVSVSAASHLASGVSIVGYFSRSTGVAESARLCVSSCDVAGIPSEIVDVDGGAALHPHSGRRATILHVNADMTPSVAAELGDTLRSDSYAIGVWHWELPEFPAAWNASAALLDEIWAPSAFIAGAIAKSVTIPVVHMPHGVEVTDIAPFSPALLGVPAGRFVFLLMFDFDSYVERKNPAAAIEAFRRAFPGDEGATLLIKTTSGSRHPAALSELQAIVSDIPNVHLVDRTLARAQVNGLIAACDAVVSLHRAEGFGLILAEAMALGKPVIATGWSGNADFMSVGNSCPVNYDLVSIERDCGPYAARNQWAEPDIDHAASLMVRVARDAEYRATIGRRAAETIRERFSPAVAGQRYRQRLTMLGLLD